MKRVVIFTGNKIRHFAFCKNILSDKDIKVIKIFSEEKNLMDKHLEINEKNLINEHIEERDNFEKKFFHPYIKKKINKKTINNCNNNFLSSKELLKIIFNVNPDLIIVFGTSIIKGDIIKEYKKKIINIHLGLSPYYKGSGTNFFPFVNNEPEYCGVTFMFLNTGIDTGKIIHQLRAKIILNDNFHLICNRLLLKMFETTKLIIKNFNILKNKKQIKCKKFKYYKTKDFNESTVKKLRKNFNAGIIENYLKNKKVRDGKVKIIKQKF